MELIGSTNTWACLEEFFVPFLNCKALLSETPAWDYQALYLTAASEDLLEMYHLRIVHLRLFRKHYLLLIKMRE